MSFYSAILIGFFGSFHCVGMCGPLFLSIPSEANPFIKAITYSLGRSLTYSSMGLIIGWLGYVFSMAQLQAPLSIGLGVTVLIATALHFSGRSGIAMLKPVNRVFEQFKNFLLSAFERVGNRSLFMIGLLNGFLPCAFVYAGLASAVTTGDPLSSALYMGIFGIGTIPAMILVALAGRFMGVSFRYKIQKLVPYFALLLGIILVARGLSLNIPFLSPDLNQIIFGDCSFD